MLECFIDVSLKFAAIRGAANTIRSTGETIDFPLSPKCETVAAKHFLRMACSEWAGSDREDQRSWANSFVIKDRTVCT
jgi:hypothetical protein